MAEPLIQLTDINKDYVNDDVVTPVLHHISFTVQVGEFVAIMGPSGCGKSTLMHILGMLDYPTSGSYKLVGREVSRLTDDDQVARIRGQQVGFVFQAFNLLPRTSVLNNVLLPLIYSGVPAVERLNKATQAITAVGLGHRLEFLSNQLSGGEKQRVAIARALVNDPSVILADEPTGNLDSKSGLQIMELLQEFNDQGKTIILVTHETMTAEFARRIIRLHDGMILSDQQVSNQRRV